MKKQKEFYSVKEVSNILEVNEETVRRWIRSGDLKAVINSKKQGHNISSVDLNDFLKKHSKYESKIGAVIGTIGIAAAVPLSIPLMTLGSAFSFILNKLTNPKNDSNNSEYEVEADFSDLLASEIKKLDCEINSLDEKITRSKKDIQNLNDEIKRYENEKNVLNKNLEKLKALQPFADKLKEDDDDVFKNL